MEKKAAVAEKTTKGISINRSVLKETWVFVVAGAFLFLTIIFLIRGSSQTNRAISQNSESINALTELAKKQDSRLETAEEGVSNLQKWSEEMKPWEDGQTKRFEALEKKVAKLETGLGEVRGVADGAAKTAKSANQKAMSADRKAGEAGAKGQAAMAAWMKFTAAMEAKGIGKPGPVIHNDYKDQQ